MLIHLENGCSVGRARLYQIASECFQSRFYVDGVWIDALQDGEYGSDLITEVLVILPSL